MVVRRMRSQQPSEEIMSYVVPEVSLNQRLERELERERLARMQHAECRAKLAADDEFRFKDARGNTESVNLKRAVLR
jgi:hypothetical protein